MKSTTYGTGPRGKATKLHSQLVRSRGCCERCGSTDPAKLQTAHIVGRRFAATRTDERTAWCLCAGCHFRLTEHPDEHMAFVGVTIGMDAFHELKQKALAGVKANDVFWQAECVRLSALLAEVEAA